MIGWGFTYVVDAAAWQHAQQQQMIIIETITTTATPTAIHIIAIVDKAFTKLKISLSEACTVSEELYDGGEV